MPRPVKIWTRVPFTIVKAALDLEGIKEERYILCDAAAKFLECEIVFGGVPDGLKQASILDASNVRWVQLDSVDHSAYPKCKQVTLTNLSGVAAPAVAEWAVGCLLAFYRGLWAAFAAQHERSWRRWSIRGQADCLVGKPVLILGAGPIVRHLVGHLKAFKNPITVLRRARRPFNGARVIVGRKALLSRLPRAEIVINALPASAETAGLCDREFFDCLNRQAVFMNVGRGMTVDEAALLQCLKAGNIKAAILDVTRQEPLLANSRLWRTPGLFLTQHIAAGHKHEQQFAGRFFARNLQRYLAGRRLINVVYKS